MMMPETKGDKMLDRLWSVAEREQVKPRKAMAMGKTPELYRDPKMPAGVKPDKPSAKLSLPTPEPKINGIATPKPPQPAGYPLAKAFMARKPPLGLPKPGANQGTSYGGKKRGGAY
jgi:hypothetical protein